MLQWVKSFFSSESTKTLTEETTVSVFDGLAEYEIPKNYTVTAKFGKNNTIKNDEKNKNKATIKAVQQEGTKYDYEFTKENQNVILSVFVDRPGDNCEVKVKEYNKTQQEFTDERIKIEASVRHEDEVLKDIKDNVKKNFFTKNNLPDFKELSKYVSEENINLLKKYSNISIKRKMSVRDIKSKYYVNGRDTLFNNILSNNIISGLRDTDIVEVEENVMFDVGNYIIKFSNGDKMMKYNVIMREDIYNEDIFFKQGAREIISQHKEYKKSVEQDFLDLRNFDDTDLDIPDFDSVYRKDIDSFVLTIYLDFIQHKKIPGERRFCYQGVASNNLAVFQGFIDRQNFNLIDGERYKVIFSGSRHEYNGEYCIPNSVQKLYDDAKPKGTGKFTFGIDDSLNILGKTVQFKKGAIVDCDNWDGLKTITGGEERKPIEISVDYNGEKKTYMFEKEKDENGLVRVICRNEAHEEVDPNDICHADENLEEAGAGLYGGGYDTGKPGTYSGGLGARRGGAGSTRTPSSSRNIERSKTPDDERTDEKNNKKDDKKKDDKEKKSEDEDDENKKISLNNENAKLSLDRNNMSKKPEFNVMLFILLLLTIVGAILYWMDYKDKLEKYENNKRHSRMMTRF